MQPMTEPVIAVDNLVKRYGKTLAVGGISFAVERGATAALLGGNGAGKTTTLSILLGLVAAERWQRARARRGYAASPPSGRCRGSISPRPMPTCRIA